MPEECLKQRSKAVCILEGVYVGMLASSSGQLKPRGVNLAVCFLLFLAIDCPK